MQADDDFDTRVTRPRVRSLLLDLTEEDFARGWVGRRSDPSARPKVEENAATAGDAPPTRRSRVLTIVVGTMIAAVLGAATGVAVSLRRPTVTAQFLHHSCLSIEDTMRQPKVAITVEANGFQIATTAVEELLPPPEVAPPPKRVVKPVVVVKAAPAKPIEEPQVATASDPEPEAKPAASATAAPAPAAPAPAELPPTEPPPTPVEDKFP